MKQILISLSVIGALAAIVTGGTIAYFSDTETSVGNTLSAGSLDLYVNGQNPLQGPVVTLADLKPSFPHYATKTIRVVDNPANVYLHIATTSCNGGRFTEPEAGEQGGLWPNNHGQERCDFNTWTEYDLKVATKTIIVFGDGIEDSRNLGAYNPQVNPSGLVSCWIPLGQYNPQDGEILVEQSFHLHRDVTNWAQGDIVQFTEEFMATQINADPPQPLCRPQIINEENGS